MSRDITGAILSAVHDVLRARKIDAMPIEVLDHLLAVCDTLNLMIEENETR